MRQACRTIAVDLYMDRVAVFHAWRHDPDGPFDWAASYVDAARSLGPENPAGSNKGKDRLRNA
eukprot:8552212-Alexandrium_andersonii.AAC.1